MKTTTQNPRKEKSLYFQINQHERSLIKHVLSPLELSALRHNYQPFHYKCNGNFIYISHAACKHLLNSTKTQLNFFTNLLSIERESKTIPRRLREVFEDPREVLSLPAYTRNRLCRIECFTMLRMMILGRNYFLQQKEFGKQTMKHLDALFAKHKCSRLFI